MAVSGIFYTVAGRLFGGAGSIEVQATQAPEPFLANMEGWKYAFEVVPHNSIVLSNRPRMICRNMCDRYYEANTNEHVLSVALVAKNRTDASLQYSVSPFATQLKAPELDIDLRHSAGRTYTYETCRNLYWTGFNRNNVSCSLREIWTLPFTPKQTYSIVLHFPVKESELEALISFNDKNEPILNTKAFDIHLHESHFSDYTRISLVDPKIRDCRGKVEGELSVCVREK